jgi:hypothetical protein
MGGPVSRNRWAVGLFAIVVGIPLMLAILVIIAVVKR